MIRRNIVLFLSSSLLVASSMGATVSYYADDFSVAPLCLDGKPSLMEFKVYANSTNTVTVKISIYNDLYTSSKSIYSSSFSSNQTVQFNYMNEYTRQGENEIRLTWQCKKTKQGATIKRNVDVSSGDLIRINSSRYFYTSNSSIFNHKNSSGDSSRKQIINFYNFENLYMPNYYHKIDISTFHFDFDGSFPYKLDFDSATLTLIDKNHIFNGLERSGENIFIPLSLYKNGNDYSLCFKNDMYVNQLTLEMSTKSQTGYVKTKYLYFPRNGKMYETDYDFNISIFGLGIDHSTFVSSFKYKSERNIIGDCRNSQYCVVNEG